jgi:hypothetical protein
LHHLRGARGDRIIGHRFVGERKVDMTRIDLQNAEFDALTELAETWKRLRQVAVVDDDYPAYRHRYEGAMKTFIAAIKANGRLLQGAS